MLEAPWTDDQVRALNAWQATGVFHPFTCGNDHDGNRVLVAAKDGWTCPGCDYRQTWAHAFMVADENRGINAT